MSPSNIVIAVDGELQVLERRVEKLREIRRLALELEAARLPAAAAPPRNPGRRASPALQVSDVIDTARDVLGEGPASVNRILTAAGRTPSKHSIAVVESALEQLGATVVGVTKGGGKAWALPADRDPDATPEAEEAEQLHAIVREILQRQGNCTDEEIQYQLRKRYGIEVSLTQAHREHDVCRNGTRAPTPSTGESHES